MQLVRASLGYLEPIAVPGEEVMHDSELVNQEGLVRRHTIRASVQIQLLFKSNDPET